LNRKAILAKHQKEVDVALFSGMADVENL